MANIPLNALKVFDSVFRHGTFYGAAEELNVTPSAVSHQIRHLEEWFGTSLFERTGKHLKFDSHAVALATSLGLALSDIDRACYEMRRKSKKHQLTIAVIPSVAICWLIPKLPRFRVIQPKADLKIIYALFGQEINFADVDVAIVYANDKPEIQKMETVQLLSGASVPVCSESYLHTIQGGKTAKDIGMCSLLHDTDTAGWREWLGHDYPATTEDLADTIFEDFNLLHVGVLSGQGVALCPPAIIKNDLATGRLLKLSTRTIHEDHNYYVIHRACQEESPVATFVGWLKSMVDDS